MNDFMKLLLSLSVSGTLLLLLTLGLKPLYKNKFSKRWQYYIWLIVVLRFLLPLAPDTTIVGSLFQKFDTTAIANEISTISNVPVLLKLKTNKLLIILSCLLRCMIITELTSKQRRIFKMAI